MAVIREATESIVIFCPLLYNQRAKNKNINTIFKKVVNAQSNGITLQTN